MNKYEITEMALKDGFSFNTAEEMKIYLQQLLRFAGIRTVIEAHTKARNIYFRFLVIEKSQGEGIESLNAKSREFLTAWGKCSESGNVNDMVNQLLTIESNQQLSSVIRLVLEIGKKNHFIEKNNNKETI